MTAPKKSLKKRTEPKVVVETPRIKVGTVVRVKDEVTEFATGGFIRGIQRTAPCRVLKSGGNDMILLSPPVRGWVHGADVIVLEEPAAPKARSTAQPARKSHISASELQILLPVTRPWAKERVCRSLAASDIPRGEVILILDAPGCEGWEDALKEAGFAVKTVSTDNPEPPAGRLERRTRHREMRRLSQTLVHDGPLLVLEDDTLVPQDVFLKLSSSSGSVSGVQVGRHEGAQTVGIYGAETPYGVSPIESCGHYCLLTTGKEYKEAQIRNTNNPVDVDHTSQIRPLSVNWDVKCGHLLEDGSVLLPDESRGGVRVVRSAGSPLKVCALVHMYPPHHNAGAEHMLHSIFSEMVRRGWYATVVIDGGEKIGEYHHDGVFVTQDINRIKDADVLFTHLDRTPDAEAWSTAWNIPLVQLFHNHYQTKLARRCDLAVYNSHWLAEMFPSDFPSIVIHPPVHADHYRVKPTGDKITLINLNPAKGARIFYGLAERFPDLEFLGVVGAYGEQIIETHPNVTIIENQCDVRTVYSQTRVLLVPSVYESYGRVAIEASVSGIPVIANSTPGLKEALGVTGIFPARIEPVVFDTHDELSTDNLDAWADALTDTLKNWKGYSARAKTLRVDPQHDIARLMGALETLGRR